MESIDKSLGYLIHKASHSINGVFNRSFQDNDHDVTSEQWKVLASLWKEDGLNQQSLSCMIGKEKTSVTRLLENMEKRDLIVRIEDKNDKRNRLIYLTNKGKVIKDDLIQIKQKAVSSITNGLNGNEIEQLKKLLAKIIDNCSQSGTNQ